MVSEHPVRWHSSGANDFPPGTPPPGWSGAPVISPHVPGAGWRRVAGGGCSQCPPLRGSGLGTGGGSAGRFSEAEQSVAGGHLGPRGGEAYSVTHRHWSRGEAGPANCASWLALWGHGLVELCSGPRRALTVLPGAVPRGLRSGTPLSIPANGIYSPQTTPETQTDSLSEPRGRISASPRSQTLLIGSLSVKPAARAPSTSLLHLRSGFAKRLVSGVSICFRKIIR